MIYGLFVHGRGEDPICNGRTALHQLGSWAARLWGGIRPLAEKGARGGLL